MIRYFLILLTLLALSLSAVESPTRSPTVLVAGGAFVDSGQVLGNANTHAVALGDLNGDGHLDAFTANGNGPAPNRVWLNNGAGYFSSNGQALGNQDSWDVALGDLDGDGDLDAVVANSDGLNQVWINNGNGDFTTGQAFESSVSRGVALGDLTGNGRLDAIFANNGGNTVWYNTGNGVFSDSGQSLGTASSYDVALADLNGNGLLDAFFANGLSNGQPDTVWFNNGKGGFSNSGQNLGNSWTYSLALGDLNGDGYADAFTASWFPNPNRVWFNDGSGVFTDSEQALGSAGSIGVSLGDVDGDGSLDAVVANNFPDGIQVWLNNGSGLLSDSGQTLGGATSYDVALADLDGDGDLDIFAANFGPDQVWLNHSLDTPGGTGQFVTSGQALGYGRSNAVALGDLNSDGHLDAFVANDGPNQVWLNTACADFSSSEQTWDAIKSFDVALGDLNGDSHLDAFVTNEGPNQVWFNDGAGRFTNSGQSLGISISLAVALGDLDGDGDLDAFVANAGIDTVCLNGEQGDAPGIFRCANVGDTSVSYDVALGDVDADGDLDAFVANAGQNVVYYNLDGAANFIHAQTFGDKNSHGVAVGDLNGNGFLDAYVANGNLDRANEIWLNEGAPFYTLRNSFQNLGNAHSQAVALGDLNGSGFPDAFVANASVNQANRVWLNNGSGQFNDNGQQLGDSWSLDVALGDLDNDGDLDAFVANDGPNKVWLNGGRGGGITCQCIVEWLSANAGQIDSRAWLDRGPAPWRRVQQWIIDIDLFYRVRDEVLKQTPRGQGYIELYYTHNQEILLLLAANADLRAAGVTALTTWQPNLQALVDGRGHTVSITTEQAQVVQEFLDSLESAASSELQQVLAEEREKLEPPAAFVGMTMAEVRGIIVGYTSYLPALTNR